MQARIDYLKLAYVYDVRVQEDAQGSMDVRRAWSDEAAQVAKYPGGSSSETISVKNAQMFIMELWGPQADVFAQERVFWLPHWRYMKVLRIDWRTEREKPVDTFMLDLIAKQRGKVGTSTQNTRPRQKKGDRDRGGVSVRGGSRASDRSVTCYHIEGEMPALECNFRGDVAQKAWADAVLLYGAFLKQTEGDLLVSQLEWYKRLMDTLQVETTRMTQKTWGFCVGDWIAGREIEVALQAGFNPSAEVIRLLNGLPETVQQQVFDEFFGLDEDGGTMYAPVGRK